MASPSVGRLPPAGGRNARRPTLVEAFPGRHTDAGSIPAASTPERSPARCAGHDDFARFVFRSRPWWPTPAKPASAARSEPAAYIPFCALTRRLLGALAVAIAMCGCGMGGPEWSGARALLLRTAECSACHVRRCNRHDVVEWARSTAAEPLLSASGTVSTAEPCARGRASKRLSAENRPSQVASPDHVAAGRSANLRRTSFRIVSQEHPRCRVPLEEATAVSLSVMASGSTEGFPCRRYGGLRVRASAHRPIAVTNAAKGIEPSSRIEKSPVNRLPVAERQMSVDAGRRDRAVFAVGSREGPLRAAETRRFRIVSARLRRCASGQPGNVALSARLAP